MTTAFIILLSISIILIMSLGYGAWNLVKKNERQEELLDKQDKYMKSVYDLAKLNQEHWEEFDTLGAYKSDDEVGIFYEYLEGFQKIVKQYIIEQNEYRK